VPTPVDASALVPALAIEPAVVPVPAVADRATAEPIDGGLARDEATRDAPVGPVAVGDQPAWDDAAWDAPSATAAPELSSDLTFLDLEGPLRTWELPVGNTGVALACPVPAASARKPLAPPLAEALRTDGASSGGAHGGERNAAVDAVVALTAARDEPGGLRGLLRRITRR
jgi:hypothetical protein